MGNYVAVYRGEPGATYTAIFGKKSYRFVADVPRPGVPEDVAAYLSSLTEEVGRRKMSLFDVYDDATAPEEAAPVGDVVDAEGNKSAPAPVKVRLGGKKTAGAKTDDSGFEG